MDNITRKILVLSGKGGVGKSTIAVNFAVWLSMQGQKVGLLDVDIHGPSIPKLLNLEDKIVQSKDEKIEPIEYSGTLKIMSIGFLLPDDSSPVIWRGPMKHNLIKQFTSDVNWEPLDYLVVDCPPGTGDEPLSVAQSLGNIDGVIVVTTPQQLSVIDVKKCISFCGQLNLPVLGVIENMSGFICPVCQHKTDIFKSQGGQQMADQFKVPFLGKIPIACSVVSACDSGRPIIQSDQQSPIAQSLSRAFTLLLQNSNQAHIDKEVQAS
jgi:ATP-binding protein involved in chromosome partitioning